MKTNILHNKKSKQCIFMKENGKQCNARAMKDKDFCYFHCSDISEIERQRHKSKGGKSKVLVVNPAEVYKDIKLNNPKQVSRFYSYLINKVMSGSMDLRLATGLSYMLNGLLKALELSEIEDRILKLENSINDKEQ